MKRLLPIFAAFACSPPAPPPADDSDTGDPDTPVIVESDTPEDTDDGLYATFPNGASYNSTGPYQDILQERLVCYIVYPPAPGLLRVVALGLDSQSSHILADGLPIADERLSLQRDFNLDLGYDGEILLPVQDGVARIRPERGEVDVADFPDTTSAAWYASQIVINNGFLFADWDALTQDASTFFRPYGDITAGDDGRLFQVNRDGVEVKQVVPEPREAAAWFRPAPEPASEVRRLYAFDVVGEDVVYYYASGAEGHSYDDTFAWFDRDTGRRKGVWYPFLHEDTLGIACEPGARHPSRAR